MNNFNEQTYYQPQPPRREPRGNAIASMVMGILSIYCGLAASSVAGIILGALAKKFSAPILAEFPGTTSANFAKVGSITGKVGLIVSIVYTALSAVVLSFYLFIIFFYYVSLLGMTFN